MTDRMDSDQGGFHVLDTAALVMGAAVASVHLREIIRDDLSDFGWALVWCTYSWVAVTATGPFLLILRRFAHPGRPHPRVGEKLWALLGLPWVLNALGRSALGDGASPYDATTAVGLMVGLVGVSMIAMVVLWSQWVSVAPEQAARNASLPWTNRIGFVLAVAWPIQWGIGLIVIS